MNKVIRFLAAMLLVVGAVSCSDHDDPVPAPDPVEEPQAPAISPDEAAAIASRAMADFGFITDGREIEHNDIKLYSTLDRDTAFYIVNYPEGGYVAVNAEKDATVKILAISNEGKATEEGLNYVSQTVSTLGFIATPEPITPSNPEPMVLERYYPTASWGDGAPYWTYCISSEGEQSMVGRTAVAMGQLLSYHKKPILVEGQPFNWALGETSESIDQVARLLHQIGVDMDATYNPYECDIDNNKIIPTLKKYGFLSPEKYTVSHSAVQMLAYGPVLVQAFSKSTNVVWVADGFKDVTTVEKGIVDIDGNKSDIYISETYLHFNWGMNGRDNAFYWAYTCEDRVYRDAAEWKNYRHTFYPSACTFYKP